MGLKRDIIKVGSANFIVLMSSLVNGLILPAYLTIQGFADFKTFTLYTSFIGFLHFGFVDGINVKYGGFKYENIDLKEFESYHKFFILFQFIIAAFFIILSLISKSIVLMFFALAILPINLQSFFLFYYQAIGEFKLYSRSSVIVPIANIVLVFLLILLKINDYKYFVFIFILSYSISILFLEINFKKYLVQNKLEYFIFYKLNSISFKRFLNIFRQYRSLFVSGFLIMVGNIIFNLFFDTGRWFVKIFATDKDFAIYSLSVSLIGFIIIFVSAINKTFYPYLFKIQNEDGILKLREALFLFSSMTLPLYFILKEIIILFIPKYLESLRTTVVLMSSIPGIFIIKAIYSNLYKVKKIEFKFFIDSLYFFVINIVFSVVLYMFFRSLISVAFGTVISIYIWTIFPRSFTFFTFKKRIKDIFYIISLVFCVELIDFLNWKFYFAFILSFVIIFMLNYFFFNNTLINFINIGKKRIL